MHINFVKNRRIRALPQETGGTKMSDKYKSTYRCYLIDHHSPQPPAIPLDRLDIAEYERFLKEAHVDSQMVYCKDHWGVTYYPSQVEGAQMHGGLQGDWIASVREALDRNGVEFIAYYCIEYDEGAARRFPEWRVRRADGEPLRRKDTYAKWSLCCYQTGYRRYCLDQLREIVKNYHPDALFLDIFGASLCYCEACRKKFQSRFGYPLPETEEELLRRRADVLGFLDGNAAEFMDELRAAVREIDPTLAITINFSCHYPAVVRDKLDYQFSEPLLGDNWFSSAYARDTAVGQSPILAPGEASQVYNYDAPEKYVADLCSIAAQGCRVGMYSGSQHADGTLDFEEARRLGNVYRELEKMHPWLTGREPVKSVGILQSDVSAGARLARLEPDAILRAKAHNPHVDAILGAMMLCENAKIPWRVLPVHTLTGADLRDYDLLILPEVFVAAEELTALLTDYVREGGKLLLSSGTGLCNPDGSFREDYAMSELMGASFAAVHEEYRANTWGAYIKPVNGFAPGGLLERTTPPVGETFTELTPRGARTLLEFIAPCLPVTETEWVNWWSPPPGTATGFPALLKNSFGKGIVFTCGFDPFAMAAKGTYRWLDGFFAALLREGGIHPPVRNALAHPHMVRTAFFRRGKELIVHQISALPHAFDGESVPVSGGKLVIDEARIPVRCARVVYPREQALPVHFAGGLAEITLPEMDIQQIVVLEG